MAQRLVFHYVPKNSCLHRWDARCKLIGLLAVTATLLGMSVKWLMMDSLILLGLLLLSHLSLRQFSHPFRTWAIFFFILFLLQAVFTPGPRWSLFPSIPVSKEGLLFGGLACWRLGLILGYAILFTAVTRPRELRDGLIWFLQPVPFLNGRRIALMVSLTLRFFSTILDQAEEVRLAHKARQGDGSRNPLRRAKFLALPILRRSFSQAEEVTLALAARGVQEDLPLRLPKMNSSHWVPLWIFIGFLMAIGWLV